MTLLKKPDDLEKHLSTMFSTKGGANGEFIPYVKFTNGEITVVKKNEDGETEKNVVEKLEGNVIYKTGKLQLLTKGDEEFRVLGDSSEYIIKSGNEPETPFVRLDYVNEEYISNVSNKADLKKKLDGDVEQNRLDFNFVVYFLDKKHGMLKMFLRNSQAIGMEKAPKGSSYKMFVRFDNPMDGSYRAIEEETNGATYKYLLTVTSDTYKAGGMEVTFPKFKKGKEEPVKDLLGKIGEVHDHIVKSVESKIEGGFTEKTDTASEDFDEIVEGEEEKKDDDLPF